MAVGEATRLLPLLRDSRKRYVFDFKAGSSTDTGDEDGRILATAPVPPGWERGLAEAVGSLVGEFHQIPPMYSAVKIAGRPLYEAARRGEDVRRAPRRTQIHDLRIVAAEPGGARLAVHCDSGTYVRALCEELGRRLGLPAHMGSLLRVAAGPFRLATSKLASDIAGDGARCIVDPLAVLDSPRVVLQGADKDRFCHGNVVMLADCHRGFHHREAIVLDGCRPVGTGRFEETSAQLRLFPTRVFAEPGAGGTSKDANS